MSELILIARLGLALVFVVAALAKLVDLAGFRQTLVDFGLHTAVGRWAAPAIVATELIIAGLLVPTPTAIAGATAAVALLAVFSAAIGRVLRRGEAPDCGCMGAARSKPVSRSTLARNAALALVAAAVAVAGPGAALTAPPIAVIVGAALVAQTWFTWQLFRQHGRLLARIRALEERATRQPSLTVVHRHRVGRLDQRLRNLEH
jgi:hypothetical protein